MQFMKHLKKKHFGSSTLKLLLTLVLVVCAASMAYIVAFATPEAGDLIVEIITPETSLDGFTSILDPELKLDNGRDKIFTNKDDWGTLIADATANFTVDYTTEWEGGSSGSCSTVLGFKFAKVGDVAGEDGVTDSIGVFLLAFDPVYGVYNVLGNKEDQKVSESFLDPEGYTGFWGPKEGYEVPFSGYADDESTEEDNISYYFFAKVVGTYDITIAVLDVTDGTEIETKTITIKVTSGEPEATITISDNTLNGYTRVPDPELHFTPFKGRDKDFTDEEDWAELKDGATATFTVDYTTEKAHDPYNTVLGFKFKKVVDDSDIDPIGGGSAGGGITPPGGGSIDPPVGDDGSVMLLAFDPKYGVYDVLDNKEDQVESKIFLEPENYTGFWGPKEGYIAPFPSYAEYDDADEFTVEYNTSYYFFADEVGEYEITVAVLDVGGDGVPIEYEEVTITVTLEPIIKTFTCDKSTFEISGGTSTITLTGENLINGIAVKASEGTTTVTGNTAGNATNQTVQLLIPPNSSTSIKTYTVQYSLDGETTWIGDLKITVNGATPGGGGGGGAPAATDSVLGKTEASYSKGGDGVSVTIDLKGNTLKDVKEGSTTLKKDTDYTVSGSTITFKPEFLDSLSAGKHTFTFVMSAGKSLTFTITITDEDAPLAEDTGYKPMAPLDPAGTKVDATKTNNTLILDEDELDFPAVKIGGYNWLKLRDFAKLLMDTEKNFSVKFDEATGIIDIVTGGAYDPLGNELEDMLQATETAIASPQKLRVDGQFIEVAAYNIKGYNYFRIRDLAIILDFAIIYDDESGAVTLDLENPYDGE